MPPSDSDPESQAEPDVVPRGDGDVFSVPLKPRRIVRPWLGVPALMLFGLGLGAGLGRALSVASGLPFLPTLGVFTAISTALLYVFFSRWNRELMTTELRVEKDGLHLVGPKPRLLPLGGIDRIAVARGRLIVSTGRSVTTIGGFRQPEDNERAGRALALRVASLPDGRARIQKMRDLEDAAAAAFARPPRLSRIVVGACLAVHALVTVTGGESASDLVRWGANAPWLIQQGEWYRLITAGLLHGGMVHVGANAFVLWSFGPVVEKLLGAWRFGLVLFVSGVCGAGMSAALNANLSVGISTAIFGLLGAQGILQLVAPHKIPAELRSGWRSWAVMVGMNGALALSVPNLDHAGHFGGAIGGIAMMGILLVTTPSFLAPPTTATRALGLTAAFAVLFACGRVASNQLADPAEVDARNLRALVAFEAASPALLNRMAWEAVAEPGVPLELAQSAVAAAERAASMVPLSAAVADTLAVAHWRAGDLEEAIAAEERALALGENAEFRARLDEMRAQAGRPAAPGNSGP